MKGRRGKEESSRFSTTVSSMASSSSPSSLLSSISSMTSALASATSSRSGRFDVTDRTKGCCGHKRQRGLIHYQSKCAGLLTTSCFLSACISSYSGPNFLCMAFSCLLQEEGAGLSVSAGWAPDLDTLSMDLSTIRVEMLPVPDNNEI